MVKTYNELSEGTKLKHSQHLERLHKSGLTTMEVREMEKDNNWKGLKFALGSKGNKDSMIALFRLNNQITLTSERKENNIKKALKTYENFGFRGKKLDEMRKELVRTSGNTFMSIAKDLQNKGFSEKESYYKTRELLKVPISDYDSKLNPIEIEILERYNVLS